MCAVQASCNDQPMTGTTQGQRRGNSLLQPQSPVELLHVPSAVTCQAAVVALQHLSLQTLVHHLAGSDTQQHRGPQHNTQPHASCETHTMDTPKDLMREADSSK